MPQIQARGGVVVVMLALAAAAGAQPPDPTTSAPRLQPVQAGRFVELALRCVHREYPNKIAHVLQGDGDARPPRALTPVFYGCYDWHSAVHGHWLLARLARLFPDAPFAPRARAALDQSFRPAAIAAEVAYLRADGRGTFERPYGLAWLLQLDAELREWDDPAAGRWQRALAPLAAVASERFAAWLPNLTHPIRSGEHSQTAFSFGLVLDWARVAGAAALDRLLRDRIEHYYGGDVTCPLAYEPSGQDFLSPCLAEADLLRRVMPPARYAAWLGRFLPSIPVSAPAATTWLRPATVTDRRDGKLAHLDGLNLSRAWMLEGIASGLPAGDARRPPLRAVSVAHARAGLAAVTGEHYEGGHWLGSFAAYLLTRRGMGREDPFSLPAR